MGAVLGLAVAAGLVRAVRSLLFEVPTSDPLSWAAAAGVLLLVAVLACLLPAVRAARVQPASVLRED